MAGDVVISKDKTWISGGVAFSAIVRGAKSYLERSDVNLARTVYEPTEQGLELIDLTNLNSEDFRKVYAALALHFHLSKDSGQLGCLEPKYFATTLSHFESLLKELASDVRAKADTELPVLHKR